jgi:hypothetical protein
LGGIPGTTKRKWHTSETFVELVVSVPPIIAALISAIGIARDPERGMGLSYLAFAAMLWLFVAGAVRVSRAKAKDRNLAAIESPRDLAGCAHVLHGLLCQRCGIPDHNPARLRITIHRVVPPEQFGKAPEWLEQVIPYVGDQGGEVGRKFSIKSGVIGLTARKHAPHTMTWDGTNPQQFIQDLVNTYNYTPQEAEHLVTYRRSWLAVPISGKSQRETIGVLFLDSGEPALFTDEAIALVIQASFGLAKYIGERYA